MFHIEWNFHLPFNVNKQPKKRRVHHDTMYLISNDDLTCVVCIPHADSKVIRLFGEKKGGGEFDYYGSRIS